MKAGAMPGIARFGVSGRRLIQGISMRSRGGHRPGWGGALDRARWIGGRRWSGGAPREPCQGKMRYGSQGADAKAEKADHCGRIDDPGAETPAENAREQAAGTGDDGDTHWVGKEEPGWGRETQEGGGGALCGPEPGTEEDPARGDQDEHHGGQDGCRGPEVDRDSGSGRDERGREPGCDRDVGPGSEGDTEEGDGRETQGAADGAGGRRQQQTVKEEIHEGCGGNAGHGVAENGEKLERAVGEVEKLAERPQDG